MGKQKKDLYSVKCPSPLLDKFLKAQHYVEEYFGLYTKKPEQGIHKISQERFLQIRAASLSTEFFEMINSVFQDLDETESRNFAFDLLFDIAHTIGKADCRHFSDYMGVTDPMEKFISGPVFFAFSGWAKVNIFPNYIVSLDNNFFLEYEHENSFEADSWLQKGEKTTFPVCIMNAGYSSGWVEEATGIKLIAVETFCRAMGHSSCQFVLAPPDQIDNYVKPIKHPHLKGKNYYIVPEFLHRKKLEDKLRQESNFTTTVLDTVRALIVVLDNEGHVCRVNQTFENDLGYKEEDIKGKKVWDFLFEEKDIPYIKRMFNRLVAGNIIREESVILTKQGEKRLVAWVNSPLPTCYEKTQYVIGTGIDVTEQRNAETEKDHLHQELQRAARLAGMSEVASGVIHNVGNVLNSLNVSTDSILEKIQSLDSGGIRKSIELLKTINLKSSPNSETAKLTQLPLYLEKYLQNLEIIKKNILDEVEALNHNIQHINTIVSMQQNYTGVSGLEEIVSPTNIMDVALTVNTDSFYRYSITVSKNYETVPDLCVDKHKVIQILLNLIQNAKQAMDNEVITTRKLIVNIKNGKNDTVIFEITDTGIGISQENLKLLFRHGFTTRNEGHGFGLHISALGAQELGGNLAAASDGEMKGATFTLTLPIINGILEDN